MLTFQIHIPQEEIDRIHSFTDAVAEQMQRVRNDYIFHTCSKTIVDEQIECFIGQLELTKEYPRFKRYQNKAILLGWNVLQPYISALITTQMYKLK